MESESPNPQKITSSASSPLRPDLIEVTEQNIDELFTYAPWDDAQKAVGGVVVENLKAAARAIVTLIPRCPLRTRALNMLVDARMLANAAITHHGVVSEDL